MVAAGIIGVFIVITNSDSFLYYKEYILKNHLREPLSEVRTIVGCFGHRVKVTSCQESKCVSQKGQRILTGSSFRYFK